MGETFSKQVGIALSNPENLGNVRAVFDQLDANQSGGLSTAEFRMFARVVLEKDLKTIQNEGVYCVHFVGDMLFKEDFGDVMKDVAVGRIDDYLDHMFDIADEDRDGRVTFEEFQRFLMTHHEDPTSTVGLNIEGTQYQDLMGSGGFRSPNKSPKTPILKIPSSPRGKSPIKSPRNILRSSSPSPGRPIEKVRPEPFRSPQTKKRDENYLWSAAAGPSFAITGDRRFMLSPERMRPTDF